MSVSASQIEELTGFLAEDPVRNCSLIEFVRRNPVQSIERAGKSFLVRGQSDHAWVYISSAASNELDVLAGRLTFRDDRFAVIEEWMLPVLVRGREIAYRIKVRDASIHIPVSDGDVERINEIAHRVELPWAAEIDNRGRSMTPRSSISSAR